MFQLNGKIKDATLMKDALNPFGLVYWSVSGNGLDAVVVPQIHWFSLNSSKDWEWSILSLSPDLSYIFAMKLLLRVAIYREYVYAINIKKYAGRHD